MAYQIWPADPQTMLYRKFGSVEYDSNDQDLSDLQEQTNQAYFGLHLYMNSSKDGKIQDPLFLMLNLAK